MQFLVSYPKAHPTESLWVTARNASEAKRIGFAELIDRGYDGKHAPRATFANIKVEREDSL